tara:strand:+ start:3465 stop:4421 length:957 start_codon:yes stop_codon:yes gene_type:complete
MNRIITITINPALDKSTSVHGIRPHEKLRCEPPVFEPGGGGINVSRALRKLGSESLAMYLAGGPAGTYLSKMLAQEGVVTKEIAIADWTRENLAVTDSTNSQQYRFGMPGPHVQESELGKIHTKLEALLQKDDILVGSGSLCPGVPIDFYANIGDIARKKQAKFILDSSGEPLRSGLGSGVFLLKPNLGELGFLSGVESVSTANMEAMAIRLIKEKKCKVMVVSMGQRGALLVTPTEMEYVQAPTVRQKSTIGAGDSMVAGMVLMLSKGGSYGEMVRYGVACGTAATMTPGSQLCNKKDVDNLYDWLLANRNPKKKIQ